MNGYSNTHCRMCWEENMEVMKLTTKDNQTFYSADHHPDLIANFLKHCPDWKSLELIQMTQEEYFDIPATNESSKLFKNVFIRQGPRKCQHGRNLDTCWECGQDWLEANYEMD